MTKSSSASFGTTEIVLSSNGNKRFLKGKADISCHSALMFDSFR